MKIKKLILTGIVINNFYFLLIMNVNNYLLLFFSERKEYNCTIDCITVA